MCANTFLIPSIKSFRYVEHVWHGIHLENIKNLALQCLKGRSISQEFWPGVGNWRQRKSFQSLVRCGNHFYICVNTLFMPSINSLWYVEHGWHGIHLENMNNLALQCLKSRSISQEFWPGVGNWRQRKLSQSLVRCGNHFYIYVNTLFIPSINSLCNVEHGWHGIHLENMNNLALQCLKGRSISQEFWPRVGILGSENYPNHLWDAVTIFICVPTHCLGPQSRAFDT